MPLLLFPRGSSGSGNTPSPFGFDFDPLMDKKMDGKESPHFKAKERIDTKKEKIFKKIIKGKEEEELLLLFLENLDDFDA